MFGKSLWQLGERYENAYEAITNQKTPLLLSLIKVFELDASSFSQLRQSISCGYAPRTSCENLSLTQNDTWLMMYSVETSTYLCI